MAADKQPVLPHRLVEVVVVIGADQYSGLSVLNAWESEVLMRQLSFNSSVIDMRYNPQVIAMLTESRAHFPDKMISSPSTYPPPAFRNQSARVNPPGRRPRETAIPEGADSPQIGLENLLSVGLMGPRYSRRTSDMLAPIDEERIRHFAAYRRRRQSMDKVRPTGGAGPDGVVKVETIQGIPRLLYPDGLQVIDMSRQRQRPKPTISYLALTELNGGRLLATSLNFYRTFRVVRREEDGRVRLHGVDEEEMEEDAEADETEGPLIFVPCSILLISKHPYFNVMKQCVSTLIADLEQYENRFEQEVMQFAACMTNTPVPPPGHLSLEVMLNGSLITIHPPLPTVNAIVDFDLSVLLDAFSTRDIIRMLTALLTQQRLVVLGGTVSKTVLACETLQLLLRPFRWHFPYVPNLPAFLLEFLEAPGSFFYGCNVAYLSEVQEAASEIVVANLETGVVDVPDAVSLPEPPREPCEKLASLLAQLQTNFDTHMLERPAPLNMDEYRKARANFDAFKHRVILLAFLEWMVDLFRGVKPCLHHHSIDRRATFNLSMFLKNQLEGRDFFEAVCNCEIFSDFMRNRIAAGDNDPWNFVEERTKFESKHATLAATRRRSSFLLSVIEDVRNKKGLLAAGTFQDVTFQPLRLVDYNPPGASGFLEANITMLRQQIPDEEDNTRKATLLRIKSELHLARGQKIDCLSDMYELSKRDVGLLCKDHLRCLLASLTREETERTRQADADLLTNIRKLVDDPTTASTGSANGRDSISSSECELEVTQKSLETTFRLPDKPLAFDEFSNLLKNALVTNDVHLHDRLFAVLTHGADQVERFRQVEPHVFSLFYSCWTEALYEILSLSGAALGIVDESEVVKVSDTVLVEKMGTGRLLLSQNSLLLLREGATSRVEHLVSLQAIQDITSMGQNMFRNRGNRALLIHHSGSDCPSPLTVWLRNERDKRLWRILLTEMWAGQVVATARKDLSLLSLAMEDAMLLNVLLRHIGEPQFRASMPYEKDSAVAQLAQLTAIHKSGDFQLDANTSRFLHRKFNVWALEGDRRSIGALTAQVARDGKVKLWCICNEDNSHSRTSRLVVIDGLSHVLESEVLSVPGELICLRHVGHDQLWVGDMNYKIYIVSLALQRVTRELVEHGHNDGVISLAANDDGTLAASGSVGGEVLVWQAATAEVIQRWGCSDRSGVMDLCFANSSSLWCCLKRALLVYNAENGQQLHMFQLHTGSLAAVPDAPMFQCLTADPHLGHIYAGLGRSGHALVFKQDDFQLERLAELSQECREVTSCANCKASKYRCRRCRDKASCHGVSCMTVIGNRLWAACKDGNITITKTDPSTADEELQQLRGHSNAIQAMCVAQVKEQIMVFTGARAEDGKIAHWHVKEDEDC